MHEFRLSPDKPIVIAARFLDDVLSFEVDKPLTPGEIYELANRINTVTYLCDCGNEFDGQYGHTMCPDCSKNQESKNA